jgi:hypothetical protein
MTDRPSHRERLVGFAHQFLERLTAMKLHVGVLRMHLQRGTLDRETAEQRLDQIEAEIDLAATLAHDLRREGSAAS